ncbi:hypothetical protein [Cohnella yongneupensis]|uniref:WYL domain-containing protein n=1 Tax=Cohnella yongneupensis TaxID=425006 RepID=A0ABW0QWF8_9BACL
MSIEKFIGRIIELIYQDSKGNITKRQISVYQVDRGKLRGFDTVKQAYRTFALERILAARPVSGL